MEDKIIERWREFQQENEENLKLNQKEDNIRAK